MSLSFEPITLEHQSKYTNRLSRCPQLASDYSFVNLWGWAGEYGLLWAWTIDCVWIKQTRPKELFWAPVGLWDEIEWERRLNEIPIKEGTFIRIPEKLLQVWEKSISNRITSEETRGHWDYIYDISELTGLRGKRFHKKNNLLNQFRKNYNFEYVPFNAGMIDMALAMQEDWCTWRDCESSETLSAENRAISNVLNNWEHLKVLGGAILVDREMAAYTIAEKLSENTLVIHFEKGNPDYKGIYQAINQMFLDHLTRQSKFVNREQDLDDEGLRKAKLTYHPVDFIKKYRVTLT